MIRDVPLGGLSSELVPHMLSLREFAAEGERLAKLVNMQQLGGIMFMKERWQISKIIELLDVLILKIYELEKAVS